MRYVFLFLLFLISPIVIIAQNVGIGVVSPGNRLDVRSDGTLDTATIVLGLISNISNRPVLQFSEWDYAAPGSGMSIEYNGAAGDGGNNRMHIRGVDAVRKFTFMSNGKMGIGTESPNELLEVAGNGRVFIGDGNGSNRRGMLIDAVEPGDYVRIDAYDYGTATSLNLYLPTTVSIGTNTGATGYKLSVDGKIMAEELKVQLSQSWPDYVFSDDYDRMPLSDLRTFIDAHAHLPGVPSAQQVGEDAGFEVGEMQRVLLEKIEELTLYILEQDQKIQDLQTQIEDLK